MKYAVIMTSGWSDRTYCDDLTWDEALEICEENNYEWCDPELRFVWSLSIVDSKFRDENDESFAEWYGYIEEEEAV